MRYKELMSHRQMETEHLEHVFWWGSGPAILDELLKGNKLLTVSFGSIMINDMINNYDFLYFREIKFNLLSSTHIIML